MEKIEIMLLLVEACNALDVNNNDELIGRIKKAAREYSVDESPLSHPAQTAEDQEKNFYDKHPNYKPYLRMIDYEGNEIKFCDIIYDYHQFIMDASTQLQEVRRQMRQEVIELINQHWTFDKWQNHTSNWHDKQDLIEKLLK